MGVVFAFRGEVVLLLLLPACFMLQVITMSIWLVPRSLTANKHSWFRFETERKVLPTLFFEMLSRLVKLVGTQCGFLLRLLPKSGFLFFDKRSVLASVLMLFCKIKHNIAHSIGFRCNNYQVGHFLKFVARNKGRSW